MKSSISNLSSWKQELGTAIRTYKDLAEYLNIPISEHPQLSEVSNVMPLLVPLSYASRIEKNNTDDPLLLQVLPQINEGNIVNNFIDDPLCENQQIPIKGLIHKYKSRVLLVCNSVCAIHCRYCFRKHFDYNDNRVSKKEWEERFNYIKAKSYINEVILSGGDPLLLNDSYLEFFMDQLSCMQHIRRVRIHTRIPIVLPSRITNSLIKILKSTRLRIIIVIHSNHPNELSQDVSDALEKLLDCSLLLNQSVLLHKINDDVDILTKLSEKLFDIGVLPYYLHTLDKVKGCNHFHISDTKAINLYKELQSKLPGFLVPKLVKEVPFRSYKVPLSEFLLGNEEVNIT